MLSSTYALSTFSKGAALKRFVGTVIAALAFFAIVWVMLFMYGMTTSYHPKPNNFFTSNMEIIAHRGGADEAPENTLYAFENAVSISPEVILEFDIHFTKDKQIVVLHDSAIDRTTNGTGLVRDLTLDELRKLDAGYNFQDINGEYPFRGKGIQIPTIIEVFDRYPETRMIIEVKPKDRELGKELYDLVKKYDRLDRTIFGSSHSHVVRYLRTLDKNILTTAAEDDVLRTLMLINARLAGIDSMDADAYCIPETHSGIQVLTPVLLSELNRRHKKAYIWTINEMEDMTRLIEAGVHGIITDRPKALSSLLLPIE